MSCEFELKFAASPEALQKALSLAEEWQTIAMETTYYDDPDHRLRSLHYTLRRRLENGISVCTLKTPLPDGSRGEWEVVCPRIEDAIGPLCALGAPRQLLFLTAQGVQPVCGARFTRRAATVTVDGTVLELALDQGVLFGSRELALCELEVELKQGSRETAITYAQSLAQRLGLTPESKSKVARAMELIQ